MFSLKTRNTHFSIARFAVEATSDVPQLRNSSALKKSASLQHRAITHPVDIGDQNSQQSLVNATRHRQTLTPPFFVIMFGLCVLLFSSPGSFRMREKGAAGTGVNLAFPGADPTPLWTTKAFSTSHHAWMASYFPNFWEPSPDHEQAHFDGFLNATLPWCFSGGAGLVGIVLREPGILSHITLSSNTIRPYVQALESPPRKVIIWGGVDGQGINNKVRATAAQALGDPDLPDLLAISSQLFVPLAHFEYRIDYTAPVVQVFPVEDVFASAGADFGVLVVDVRSNWGAPVTCLGALQVVQQP